MTGRTGHIEGFTLAELLLAIAIILVLAAIAIPSVITTQANLRMLELNNAAEQIANAAQTQMTAKKVSGTWWSTIQKGGTGADAADCAYPEATGAPGADGRTLSYMTADQAKSAGIVAPLSVDEDVRSGAYVIEFDADTASVSRVFYADGKTGFFGSADPASAQGVYAYYGTGGGSTDADVRKGHTPMIGLYNGTPAGATAEKALKNPVVSVDEKTGCLWVQDPNLDKATGSGDTATTLKLEKTNLAENEEPAAFRISGLSSGTQTVVVSLVSEGDDEDQGSYATKVQLSDLGFLDQVNQNTGEGTGNVFSLDLNALVRAVENASASPGSGDIAAVLKRFASGDQVKVQAATRLVPNSAKCIPATATAYIEWPVSVGKLSLMVTNPYSSTLSASDTAGANAGYLDADNYRAPTVEALTTSGTPPVTGIKAQPVAEDNPLKSTTANGLLINQNKQAGWQSYAGGWLSSSDVNLDPTLRLRATVGSYTGSSVHRYQIAELWVRQASGDYVRAGFLSNGAWSWAVAGKLNYSNLEQCLTWYDAGGASYDTIAGRDTDALDIVSVEVGCAQEGNLASVLNGLGLLDADGNASIYVRTIPKMSDVQAYFNGKATSGALKQEITASNGRYGKIGSRGSGAGLLSAARQNFETEFGASSSDVSWVITPETGTGFAPGDAFIASSDVRVYYSIAPGLGFPNIRSNNDSLHLRSTEMTNVALWLYRGTDSGLQAQPAALVQRDAGTPYYCEGGSGSVADFELKTSQDYLFYRVLRYYDADGTTKLKPSQYMPHIVQSDPRYATISGGDNKPDEQLVFAGWETADTSTGGTVTCAAGATLGDYASVLALRGTDMRATYVRASIGLVYLEFDGSGVVTGAYGSVKSDEGRSDVNTLTDANPISSWGYYAVVPPGAQRPTMQVSGVNVASEPVRVSCVVAGEEAQYDAYRLSATTDAVLKATATPIPLASKEYGALKETYYVNFNFAHAVTTDEGRANTWGSSRENPWSVRHAMQFPGSLKWTGASNSVQSAYMRAVFLQEHAIDMEQASSSQAYRFDATFSGTYYGGGFDIENSYRRCLDANGFGYAVGNSQGLFPKVSGASLHDVKAVVRDVQEITMGSAVKLQFGILVGSADGSVVLNGCSVTGVQSSPDGPTPTLRLAGVNNNSNSFGMLVGYASGAVTTYACTVEGLLFDVSPSAHPEWNGGLNVGGLVGQVAGSYAPTNCTVRNWSFTTSVPSKSVLSIGGFLGYGATGIVVYAPNSVQNIQLILAADQGTASNKLSVGAFGGTVGMPVVSSAASSNVTYQLGEGEAVPVTKPFGNR